jgi:nitric oxide reductase subunit C
MYSPVGYWIAGVDTVGEATRPAGILVYKQQYCGVCHTFSKAGTKGPFGPSHDGIRATAEERVRSESYTGRATTAAEYLRESIVDPAAFVVPGFASTRYTMPAYSHLTDAEIDSLVALLLADD